MKSFHFASPDLWEINAYKTINLGLRLMQIQLTSSFMAEKELLHFKVEGQSKWGWSNHYLLQIWDQYRLLLIWYNWKWNNW